MSRESKFIFRWDIKGGRRGPFSTLEHYLLVRNNGLGSTETTSTPGSNETNLLTRGIVPGGGGGVTNVLMVTTTMGVIHRIHRHTTDTGPLVTLCPVLEVCASGLEQGLLNTSSSSNQADHGTACGGNQLLCSRGELDSAWT